MSTKPTTDEQCLLSCEYCVYVVERSEAIRCFLCSTSLDGDKCKSDQIANHNASSTGNCAYCQVFAYLCFYNVPWLRMLWHTNVRSVHYTLCRTCRR